MCVHLCVSPYVVVSFGRSFKKRLPLRNGPQSLFPPKMLSNFIFFVEAELFFFLAVVLVGLKLERNIHITKVVIHKNELAANMSSACQCSVPKWCHPIDVHLAAL